MVRGQQMKVSVHRSLPLYNLYTGGFPSGAGMANNFKLWWEFSSGDGLLDWSDLKEQGSIPH